MSPIGKLAGWSASHHGVVTSERLERLGLTRDQVRHLCGTGALAHVRRGLFVVTTAPPTELQRVAIACVATRGAASITTAGRMWAFRGVPVDVLVRIAVPYERMACGKRLDGVRVHRSRSLPDTDIVRRRDGICLTSPPRTLFDLAHSVDDATLESMIEQGIDRGMFGIPTLWGVARRLASSGRDGSTRFVDVLARRPAWRKPVGSQDELRLEHLLVAAGPPRPVRQHSVVLTNGQMVHPDLTWPDLALAFEVDHVTWHGGRIESTYDKWRDRQMRVVGWEVDRVTDTDIRRRPVGTVRDLVAIYSLRAESRR